MKDSKFIEEQAVLAPEDNLPQVAEILKAIAHPVRLCIVRGLWQRGGCNVAHMQHCLKEPQSTISQHLARLRAAGIIEGERSGTEITYRLKSPVVRHLLESVFEKERDYHDMENAEENVP
ncbi:metalloregulator ArsR/SmtB family transcription factor [Selenomonas sp. TAMA-11512]|uniref:ArsR/SmtB family transcription factor n=1 Tax=Selenomonas sp. TAMA-11512 TaxID=3095337 RepID=UPI0030D23863